MDIGEKCPFNGRKSVLMKNLLLVPTTTNIPSFMKIGHCILVKVNLFGDEQPPSRQHDNENHKVVLPAYTWQGTIAGRGCAVLK